MSKAAVVFIMPEPTDETVEKFQELVVKSKELFSNREDVTVYAAIRDAADEVNDVFESLREDGNLVSHAKRELERLNNDNDFNQSIIKAVRAFSSYGHSGGSASVAIPLLNDLLQFKNLTPLTNNPEEWNDVSEMSGHSLWQSKRNPEAFSEDKGVTYYLLSEENEKNGKVIHISDKVDVNGA